jgi:hypothetical protein
VTVFSCFYLIHLPTFVTVFKLRKLWWTGQTAGMGRSEIVTEILQVEESLGGFSAVGRVM